MAFNGSGNFERLYDWTSDAAAGINISSSKMDGEDDGFATGLSNCITKDGQTTITANIPMNSKIFTGLGSGQVLTLPQINDTSSDHQYIYAVNELTADRTVTLPLLTGDDEFTFNAHAQTLSNKTLASPVFSGTATNFTSTGIDDNASAKRVDVGDTYCDIITGSKLRAVDGMLFGADTAAANTLDDYEEGTFTAAFTAGTGTITIGANQTGYYTKIGNRVFISGYFDISAISTPSGELTLTGLPFAAGALGSLAAVPVVIQGASVAINSYAIGQLVTSGATMAIRDQGVTGNGATLAANIDTGTVIYIGGNYLTA